MKKILLYLCVSIILFFTVSCGTNITYFEEFPFLPAYPDVELKEFYEPRFEDDYGKAEYIVENEDVDEILANYERILRQDGWEITYDGKPQMLIIEKEEHEATVLVYEREEENILEITAR